MAKISWKPVLVEVKKIKATPNNYKIKTDLGKARLNESLSKFGLAGTVVVNTDLVLIDGNSRLVEEKEKGSKKIWCSMPNRKLTPKEFKEMSAMFDFAKAGEVDTERITKELGTSKDFFEAWGLDMPVELKGRLEKLGANQKIERVISNKIVEEKPVILKEEEFLINLFYNQKEEALFRKLEEKAAKKLKSKSTSETVFKVLKAFTK